MDIESRNEMQNIITYMYKNQTIQVMKINIVWYQKNWTIIHAIVSDFINEFNIVWESCYK